MMVMAGPLLAKTTAPKRRVTGDGGTGKAPVSSPSVVAAHVVLIDATIRKAGRDPYRMISPNILLTR